MSGNYLVQGVINQAVLTNGMYLAVGTVVYAYQTRIQSKNQMELTIPVTFDPHIQPNVDVPRLSIGWLQDRI